MLYNLKAEMARIDITSHDIARTIDKSERAVREKIKGIRHFTHPETIKVRDTYFRDLPLEYLFAGEPAPARPSTEGGAGTVKEVTS